jgi:tetratricopeptide (TPR) repeat protein
VALGIAVGPCRALAASAATEADAALKRGVELRRRGDDAQALIEFQRAYAWYRSPRALAQIGFAEQALGRWHDAEEHLGQALADTDDAWIRRNRATIEQSRAVVAAHLGSLEVLGSPEGAELRVDGRLVGRLPMARPFRVAAGNVGVELRADGYLPSSRPVAITAGQLSRETITLQRIEVAAVVAASPAAPPPLSIARAPSPPDPALPPIVAAPLRAPENTAGGWQRSAAWITGAAAILFASGAAFALVARGRYADQLSAAVRARRCVQDGYQFRGDGAPDCAIAANNRDRAEVLGLAGGGVAGACALASAFFFTVGGRF